MINVYRHNSHVYLPTLKNASTSYAGYFKSSGWISITLDDVVDDRNIRYFSHIQHPDVRHTKGVLEHLNTIGMVSALDTKDVGHLLCFACYDNHTMPIVKLYHKILDRIHWIPIDIGIDSEQLTNDYLAQEDLPFRIDRPLREAVASPEKRTFQEKIHQLKKIYSVDKSLANVLYCILNEDLELYCSVIDRYRGSRQ